MTTTDDDTGRRKWLYRSIGRLSRIAGLDSEDRRMLINSCIVEDDRNVSSSTELTIDELEELHQVLYGWTCIQRIRRANGDMLNEAKVLVERVKMTANEAADKHPDAWQ